MTNGDTGSGDRQNADIKNSAPDNKAGVRIGVYLMMFGLGSTLTMIAPMLPRMVEDYALSLAEGSLFTVLMNVGGVLGVVLTWLISDRVRKNILFLTGYAALFICMFIVGGVGGYELLLVVFFVMGAGSRIADTLANPLITENYPDGANRYLNITHMSISIGGLLGPVALRLLMERLMSWQGAFRVLSGMCLILFIVGSVLLKDVKYIKPPADKAAGGKPVWTEPFVVTASLMIFFYSGHQIILNVWSPMFMEDIFLQTPLAASISTTLFWTGIALSRLICSRIATHQNARALIRGGALAGGAALAAAVFSPFPELTMVCFALTGLFSGATIPILMYITARAYPGSAGKVAGTLYLFSMTANMSFPWICGIVSDSFGFRAGFAISAASLFILLGLSFWRFSTIRRGDS